MGLIGINGTFQFDHYKAHEDEKRTEGCEVQHEDLVEYFREF